MRMFFRPRLLLALLFAFGCGRCDDARDDDALDGSTDGSTLDGSSMDGSTGDAGSTTCPAAPGGSDAQQQAALATANSARLAMGVPCAEMIASVNQAANAHCAYYAAHKTESATCFSPAGNWHSEVMTCSGFTGASFSARMTAAGYAGSARFEDMAFSNDGAAAVTQWIDSVWHRTPVLSPWIRDLGYGHATACDTMDFGVGATASSSIVAVYPHAGQSGVPRSFDGSSEGPEPPVPPSGWPSGYPITVYAKGISTPNQSAMTHVLTVNGNGTPIAHQWLTPATHSLLTDAYVLYANAPLAANTTYRVQVSGTSSNGAVAVDVTFTTGAN